MGSAFTSPKRAPLILLLLSLLLTSPAAADEGAGIRFPNSGAEQAQADFLEGLKLLHCFEYESAKAAFRSARSKDPGFAMAVWGEALCHVRPIWNEEDLRGGRTALARLEASPAAKRTEREEAFLRAARVLLGDGDRKARYRAYADEMAKVARAYPDDPDAAAFHGLSVLGTAMGVRDREIYDRAGAIMEPHFEKHPTHPGLAHYLVHCYDDPENAERGLEAARALAKAAPNSSHALHMPSHIFLALGLWPEVVSSNQASWRASEGHNHHALYWLQYGYLQLGRLDDAASALQEMASAPMTNDKARLYLVLMRAAQLVDGGCPGAARSLDASLDGLSVEFHAATFQADGYCAWRAGDAAAVQRARNALQTALAGAPQPTTPMGKQQAVDARLALGTLSALVDDVAGRQGQAIERLREVMARARQAPAEFGPPSPPKPAAELLGDLLLATGKAAEAADAYRAALELYPERAASRRGLAKATQRDGGGRR